MRLRLRLTGLVWLVVLVLLTGCGSEPEESPGATGTRPSGDAASHLAAAQAAADRGDLAAAEQAYRNAIALDAQSAKAQFGLGNLMVKQNRLPEAEAAFKAATAADANMAAAHANLGVVYYQMGQLSQAVTQFETALRLEPDDAATLYLLAAVRLQSNDLAAAEPLLIKARDLKPDLPEVYYGLGVLYRLKGQKDEAIQAFEKFLKVGQPQDLTALDHARQELQQLRGQ